MILFEKDKTLVLDGAMGTLLQKYGVPVDPILWTALSNLNSPETVITCHKEYIEAGADIITSNTFRTNPYTLAGSKYKSEELVKRALELAKESLEGKQVKIAGSNPPAEDCYSPTVTASKKELEYNHHKHISLLMESGSDFILNETQSHFEEIKIICEYCNNDIPFVVSIFFTEEGKLLSGEDLHDVISYLKNQNVKVISFNCVKPELFFKHLNPEKFDFRFGVYLNYGLGNLSDISVKRSLPLPEHKEIIKKITEFSPTFIGSCCGSTPEYTYIIKTVLNEQNKS